MKYRIKKDTLYEFRLIRQHISFTVPAGAVFDYFKDTNCYLSDAIDNFVPHYSIETVEENGEWFEPVDAEIAASAADDLAASVAGFGDEADAVGKELETIIANPSAGTGGLFYTPSNVIDYLHEQGALPDVDPLDDPGLDE